MRRFARLLAQETHVLRERLLRSLASSGDRQVGEARASLASQWPRAENPAEAADALAQSVVCAATWLAAGSQPGEPESPHSRLPAHLADWERWSLEKAREMAVTEPFAAAAAGNTAESVYFYEHFLRAYDKDRRKRRGVFFTPRPVADFLIAEVDRMLRKSCELSSCALPSDALPGGLASLLAEALPDSAVPQFIDPACGSGVFLVALIERLQREGGPLDPAALSRLLERMIGIEILPPAALLAKLHVARALAAAGYDFQHPAPIRILLADALAPETQQAICEQHSIPPGCRRFPILVGNPPFASLTAKSNLWIARLVRGDRDSRGYVEAAGQKLHERKTWLHDDYVKFFRLGQWHVEQAGAGLVALVTNHGYLDNATFRLMRQELLRVFPQRAIVDLHGNRKKHEVAPDGSRDENVFGLEQGIALGVFCRPTFAERASEADFQPPSSAIQFAELWGQRASKLAALAAAASENACVATLPRRPIAPGPCDWRFQPVPTTVRHPEYERGWSLAEAMPLNATAPVTARDHFVVDFTAEALTERIERFCDLSIPDEEIRDCYFNRTRSERYPPGDTRGWKLAAARRAVAADPHWRQSLVRCLYRPLDWRVVFWHPAMIDWPRQQVTRHLLAGAGELGGRSSKAHGRQLCLIARRQQLPTQPCTFFWIADGLALDGVIRSDNRGSESLFPLYLVEDEHSQARGWRANFASDFVRQMCAATRLDWLEFGSGDQIHQFGPEDLLAYIYALFHASHYRDRYAAALRLAFPRVLLPAGGGVFAELCHYGRQLIDLHLLREPALPPTGALPQALDVFRAGGHRVLAKWLQPAHRRAGSAEYEQRAAAVAGTLAVVNQIDHAISRASATSAFAG